MFADGYLRLILSVIVVKIHLYPTSDTFLGSVAVFSFYCLSGYLITRTLHNNYGFDSLKGLAYFSINRLLRLYPAYAIVITLTLIANLYVPILNNNTTLRFPQTTVEIITNFAIIGQVGADYLWSNSLSRLAVTSWSLSIELVCQLLLGAYFAKNTTRLVVFAFIGLFSMTASTYYCVTGENPLLYGPYCYQNRYGVIQAGFIPFALGGIVYLHRYKLLSYLPNNLYLVPASLFAALLLCSLFQFTQINIAPYLGIFFISYALVFQLKNQHIFVSPTYSYFADFCGRSSYHLFISHISIGTALAYLGASSFVLFLLTLIISMAISILIVPIEKKIDVFRKKLYHL